MKQSTLILFVLLVTAGLCHADLQAVDDEGLSEVSGQAGIYLSGEISINENGGPIRNAHFGDCSQPNQRCGGRIAVQTKQDGGWFVLDDIRGSFAFQGLTLRSREINSGFGGDGAEFNDTVLEIGLPDEIKMRNFQFTYGSSSTARPSDPGFRQTDIYQVRMHGDVTMQGNLLIFPTGNP
jgi:hypothetical protein